MLPKPILQLTPSPQQPALRRRNRHPKLLRYIRHRQLLNIPQQKRVSQQRRDPLHFTIQDLGDLIAAYAKLGRLIMRGQIQSPNLIPNLNIIDI